MWMSREMLSANIREKMYLAPSRIYKGSAVLGSLPGLGLGGLGCVGKCTWPLGRIRDDLVVLWSGIGRMRLSEEL